MIPVHVITGFLGSGKTTLLQKTVKESFVSKSALLVNEFGEVGIDHLLLSKVSENTILLDNGCICCSILSNLSDTLNDLLNKREQKIIPPFERVIIETTGLAEPGPIIATLNQSILLKNNFKLASIVTVVDLSIPEISGEVNDIWISQVSASDVVIFSKSDLLNDAAIEKIKDKTYKITMCDRFFDSFEIDSIIEFLLSKETNNTLGSKLSIRSILPENGVKSTHHHSTSLDDIYTFAIEYNSDVLWTELGLWLTILLNRHGKNILRIKGVLYIKDHDNPISIHGVQHVIYDPVELEKSHALPKKSVIIFITKGVKKEQVTASLQKMLSFNNWL